MTNVPTIRRDVESEQRSYEQDQAERRMRGLIHDIRAEAQNLQSILREVLEKGKLEDPESRQREVSSVLQDNREIFGSNKERIDSLLEKLVALLDGNPGLYERCGDEITNVENSWEKARRCWLRSSKGVDETLRRAEKVNGWLNEVVYRCGIMTIPSRVNEDLRGMSVGQPLNFKDRFEDELPDPEHRLKLLNYMSATPLLIEGVIDTGCECIYRANPSSFRRWLSVLGPLALVLVGGALLLLFTGPLNELLSTDFDSKAQLGAYALVFAGGIAHLAVSTLKDVRQKEDSSILILHDWWMWAHIREGAIYKKVAYLWVGFFGLILLPGAALEQPGVQATLLQTAFFVGYSVDSFVDIFLSRFTQTISTRTVDISKAIEGK